MMTKETLIKITKVFAVFEIIADVFCMKALTSS